MQERKKEKKADNFLVDFSRVIFLKKCGIYFIFLVVSGTL